MRGRVALTGVVVACVACFALGLAAAEAEPKEQALSWQKKARDTRAQVVAVAQEIEEIGVEGNAAASGQFEDAKRWLQKGDDTLAQADAKMEAEDFQPASYDYNMAWQYYVKAATAGLLAKGMLTGE
jgi:hypothetical protein